MSQDIQYEVSDKGKTHCGEKVRGCLVCRMEFDFGGIGMEFDGIGIHRRNLTLEELDLKLTTRLVGRNSIPSLKPRNDEFLKLWNSMEFKGFHQVHSANQTSLRNLVKGICHSSSVKLL